MVYLPKLVQQVIVLRSALLVGTVQVIKLQVGLSDLLGDGRDLVGQAFPSLFGKSLDTTHDLVIQIFSCV